MPGRQFLDARLYTDSMSAAMTKSTAVTAFSWVSGFDHNEWKASGNGLKAFMLSFTGSKKGKLGESSSSSRSRCFFTANITPGLHEFNYVTLYSLKLVADLKLPNGSVSVIVPWQQQNNTWTSGADDGTH